MKKLIITLGVFAVATVTQAATILWNSAALFKAVDSDGTKGTDATTDRLISYSSAQWYVFTDLSETQFNAAKTAGTVYGWLSGTPSGAAKIGPTAQGTLANGTMGSISTDKYSGGDTVRWAVVITYTDTDNKVWYTENYGTDTFDGLGSQITKGQIAIKNATTGANISTWTSAAAPEPTSGLMLLLGIGLMALKRKRV